MDNSMIKKYAVTFGRARNNLLLVVAFTTINLILAAFESGFFFLFSATMPTIIFEFIGAPVGIILAFGGVLIYLICWLLAKKYRAFILVALILFSIDTIVFFILLFGVMAAFEIGYLLEIAFHAWVMFYLITGTMAWVRLMKVTPEQIKSAQAEVAKETANAEADAALKSISDKDDEDPK